MTAERRRLAASLVAQVPSWVAPGLWRAQEGLDVGAQLLDDAEPDPVLRATRLAALQARLEYLRRTLPHEQEAPADPRAALFNRRAQALVEQRRVSSLAQTARRRVAGS